MKQSQNVIIECIKGDIACQSDITAIVNAANAQLKMGGGVAGAIHNAAGPDLVAECRPLAPIKPGEAVITAGHRLPNRYVIHCLGPVYGIDQPEDKFLKDCYRNALRLAEQYQIDSIVFPAISTGAFGYPFTAAAKLVFKTMEEIIPSLKYVKKIRFILHNYSDLEIYNTQYLIFKSKYK